MKAHVKQHEKRTQVTLVELMRQGVVNVTVNDCAGWHRHVTRYMMDCAARVPLR